MPDDAAPSRPQIERQLARLMDHPIFKSRVRHGEVIEFLVRRTLEEEDVSEQALLDNIFPETAPDSNVARVTVDALRTSLDQYYRECADLVIIELPKPAKAPPGGKRIKFRKGEAYKIRFRYNTEHKIQKDYLLAWNMFNRSIFSQLEDLLRTLRDILDQEPEHVGAMVCLSDAICVAYMMFDLPSFMHRGALEMASDLTTIALYLAPNYWRSHTARGLYHCCLNEYEIAGREFEAARKLDRFQTEAQTFYSLFLLKSGKKNEALELVELFAQEQFDEPIAQCNYGIHLCIQKRFADADLVFQRALRIDPNCWLAHFGAAYVYVGLGVDDLAKPHVHRLEVLLNDQRQFEYWMSIVNPRFSPNEP